MLFHFFGNYWRNLYTIHPKKLNHEHKDIKDLLSVIIILGTDVHGGETVFYDGKNMNEIRKIAHVLNHSHGRCVIGSFDKSLHEGHQILQQPWIIALSKSNETFIIVSIFEMPTLKYWQNFRRIMEEAKLMIPKEYRIGDTCFTSLETIGGNLYTRHVKNLNHVHKDSKDSKYLMSVIIILVTDVNGGEIVFNYGKNTNDIGKRAHVLKHSHGRCVIGSSDKILHEGSIWTDHGSILLFILHKSTFLHFVHNGTRFYEIYIS